MVVGEHEPVLKRYGKSMMQKQSSKLSHSAKTLLLLVPNFWWKKKWARPQHRLTCVPTILVGSASCSFWLQLAVCGATVTNAETHTTAWRFGLFLATVPGLLTKCREQSVSGVFFFLLVKNRCLRWVSHEFERRVPPSTFAWKCSLPYSAPSGTH